MRCGSCGTSFDASGTYASGGSCPSCGGQMSPQAVFEATTRPASGAPPLSAGGWGGRPRYRIGSSIGDILEGTFRVWAQTLVPNFLLQCVPLVLSIPVTIAAFVVAGMASAAGFDDNILPVAGVAALGVILMIASIAAYAGSFIVLDDAVRQQGDENAFSAFGTAIRRMPAMLIGSFLISVVFGVIVGAPTAVVTYAAGDGLGALLGVFMMIPAAYFGMRTALMLPAMLIEELGPVEAIVRSFDLTRGHVLTLFVSTIALGGLSLFLFLFFFVLSMVPLIGFFASLAIIFVCNTLGTAFIFTLFAGFRDADENRIHGTV